MKINIELDINNNRILGCDVKYGDNDKKGRGRPRKVKVNINDIIPVPPILPPVIPPDEQVTIQTGIPAPVPPVEVPKINPKPIPEAPKALLTANAPEDLIAKKVRIIQLKQILAGIEQRKHLKGKVESYRK